MRAIMTKYFSIFLMVIFGSAASLAQDPNRASDDPDAAVSFILGLSEETTAVFSDATLSAEDRKTAFDDIFSRATDIELLSKSILGAKYRRLTKDQRAAYMDAMQRYIISELDKYMEQIGFQTLEIQQTVSVGKRGTLMIRTFVEREEGQALKVNWIVRRKKGEFQIINIEVEGINLLITNREVFASRIKDVGIDGLISELNNSASD